jgi:hypothetical protein
MPGHKTKTVVSNTTPQPNKVAALTREEFYPESLEYVPVFSEILRTAERIVLDTL